MGAEKTTPAAKTATEMVEQVANDTETTDLNEDSKNALREQLKTDLEAAKDKQIHWSQRERGDFVNEMKAQLDGDTATDKLDKVADLLKREIETEVFETEMDAAAQDYEGADSDAAETDENPARRSIEQTYERLAAELPTLQRKELQAFLKEQLATAHDEGGWIDSTVSQEEANEVNKAIVIKANELEPNLFEKGGILINEVAETAGIAVATIMETIGLGEGESNVEKATVEQSVDTKTSTAEAVVESAPTVVAATVATEEIKKRPAAERMQESEKKLKENQAKVPKWYDANAEIHKEIKKKPKANDEKAQQREKDLTSSIGKLKEWGVTIDEKKITDSVQRLMSSKLNNEGMVSAGFGSFFGGGSATEKLGDKMINRLVTLTDSIEKAFPNKESQTAAVSQFLEVKGLKDGNPDKLVQYIAFADVGSDIPELVKYMQAKNETVDVASKIKIAENATEVAENAKTKTDTLDSESSEMPQGIAEAQKSLEAAMDAFKAGNAWEGLKGLFKAFGDLMSGISKMILTEVPEEMADVPLIGGAVAWAKEKEAADKAKTQATETAATTLSTSLETTDKLSKSIITALQISELTMEDFKSDSEKLKEFKKKNNIANDNAEFTTFTKKIADKQDDKNKTTLVWKYLLANQEKTKSA